MKIKLYAVITILRIDNFEDKTSNIRTLRFEEL